MVSLRRLWMSGSKRDYKREYELYHSKPKQKKRRAERNASRKKVADSRGVKPTSIKGDVDHKDRNTKNQSKSNLRVQSKSNNRSYSRKGEKGHGPR